MNHRFLHTLVFSSVMALEGCAAAPPADPTLAPGAGAEAEAAGAALAGNTSSAGRSAPAGGSTAGSAGGSSSAGSASSSSYGSGGGSTRSASRSPEPAEASVEADVDADAVAMRLCEIGWGTTKGGRRQVNPWDCAVVSVDGAERTECTDASGRCIQP